jgi:hypothetical protein
MTEGHRMMKRRTLLYAVALATALGAPGCHAYHRVEPAELSRGSRVRVVVDRPVAVRLREVTIEQARSLEAETVGVENGSLVLSAIWVERVGGISTPAEGWTVTVPVAALGAVSERRFSWARTALGTGLVVLGTAIGWRAFGFGASGGVGPGGGNGEPL